jgi:hypothetical protein
MTASEFSFDLENPICCWNFVEDETFFEYMMTGYARIVVHHVDKGIIAFKEGHFKNGKQLDFGRFIELDDDADTYSAYQMFTGWFPTEDLPGLGISAVDDYYYYEGEWSATSNFPSYGHDLLEPTDFTDYYVTDLRKREIPTDYSSSEE